MRKITDRNDSIAPPLNLEFTHDVIVADTGNIPLKGEKGAILCKIFNPILKQFIYAIRLCEGEQPVDGFYAFGAYGTEKSALSAAKRRSLVIVAMESSVEDKTKSEITGLQLKEVSVLKNVDISVVKKAIKDGELLSFCLRSDRLVRREEAEKWKP